MSAVVSLADSYLQGIADLRTAVAGMTREQLLAKPVPGRMSTQEVICHIADFEPIMAERMKRIIALGDTPLILAADENLFLKELHYEERDVENELLLIEATRKQMAPLLRTLRPEQFQKSGVHTQRGLITLERVVQLAINHIAHHVPFIHEKRKALNI